MNRFENYTTLLTQTVGAKEGAISPSITPSASFGYGTAEHAEAIFSGQSKDPLYARMGNPTTMQLERTIASMDGALGAIATSSGMGAITLAVLSLAKAGDSIISIGGLFGGTYALFSQTLPRFGIETSFFDVDALDAIEAAITPTTKLLFLESVGNPNMRLPDIQKIASIAKKHNIALIVDNTITPLSIAPFTLGADIVIYSTTKIISGNATALGGIVLFRALCDQESTFTPKRYAFLEPFIEKVGASALLANAKKRVLRDFGMSANAHASYQTLLGLETLPLRLSRIVNSLEYLLPKLQEAGFHLNHPLLQDHPHNHRYKEHFSNGCGTLFTIDMGTKERAYKFLNNSKIATITANIGDSRTLALHMASTIYRDFSQKDREFLGITDGLIRISIGLENPDDILEDFIKAAN